MEGLANHSLGVVDPVLRGLGALANDNLQLLLRVAGVGDRRGRRRLSDVVGEDFARVVLGFPDAHARVLGAEIDADDFWTICRYHLVYASALIFRKEL